MGEQETAHSGDCLHGFRQPVSIVQTEIGRFERFLSDTSGHLKKQA
jgi:hypothetical protein